MTLIYVTGLPGTGKSAVMKELRARGYFSRGVDEDGYADWVNLATGKLDAYPRDDSDMDFHAWYRDHDWRLSATRIGRLRRVAARVGVPVFLCGVASGEDAVWHLFDQVVALVADETTIRQRIAGRADNKFGQAPEELAAVLRGHTGYEAAYRGFGAVVIDATRSIEEVVDEIIANCIQA